MKEKIIYVVTVVCSLLYIFIGNQIATQNLTVFDGAVEEKVEKAVVTAIVDRTSVEQQIGGLEYSNGVNIRFQAKIIKGEKKGELITAVQNSDPMMPTQIKEVEVGDKIMLMEMQDGGLESGGEKQWTIAGYVRSDALIILAVILAALLLLFGRKKGIKTILSLAFTCLSIFIVYIPAILSGLNIYVWSIITCIYIIVMTMMIINGTSKKSFAAGLGCASGVFVSGVLTFIMDQIIKLTGVLDEQSYFLLFLNEQNPIDLKAIVFGSIIIGAIGAIMDVSMDITSSLQEISSKVEYPSLPMLVKSGFTIGRDIMGTMANTLVLAYIGSSMSMVLLLAAYSNSLLLLFNREMIVVEILQALVGSFGILFTIPFTSFICGILYRHPASKQTA